MGKFAVVVPTLNPGPVWDGFAGAVCEQTVVPEDVLIVDSSSDGDFGDRVRKGPFSLVQIGRGDFNHGGTRQYALELVPRADIIVFLTQDALPAHPESFEKLLACFRNPAVGVAYGRQLPRRGAGAIEAHSRLYNYGAESQIRSLRDAGQLGLKTAFCSNSFAAYRRSALTEVGGFPSNVIFGEDMYVAARMLMAGWTVAYCAEAQVYHSHPYRLAEEFRRSFDIGVFHAKEEWLLENFGKAEGEGMRFVLSELKHLSAVDPAMIPFSLLRNAAKILGYRLGRRHEKGPDWLTLRSTMNKGYWKQLLLILFGIWQGVAGTSPSFSTFW
ncbi:MAG: rhamnosyltransferase [Desulfuromonas sp.]|nr:MAG: rhamnosyltransferase [Desulfuromonas sp.]